MPITREIRSKQRKLNLDLGQLSAPERLFLWRHRHPSETNSCLGRSGGAMTQAEAARMLKMSEHAYSTLENGQRTLFSAEDVEKALLPISGLQPTAAELCLLARRRSGRMMKDIERELRVSRPRFYELERAASPMIISFWTAAGFIFPPGVSSAAA